MILSSFKDSERQSRGEGGRGKDGDVERLKAGVGGRLEGLQRWRWGGGGGGGGWTDAAVCSREQTGRVCVFLCVCVLGEEGLSQSRWGYILCFMVTGGRINHCFIKRPESQSTSSSSSSSPRCGTSLFPLPPSFLTLSSIFPTSHHYVSTSPHPATSPPFSTSCHRPSTQPRQP